MLRGPRSPFRRICGIRTVWITVGDGEFFCPECGGDRNYRRRTGRRRLTVLGMPLLPRGTAGPVVECAACHTHFDTEALDHPTTSRFSAMLRDAVHTVALAVLSAGGAGSRTALATAAETVRSAGFQDCTEDQLAALIEALAADTGRLAGPFAELQDGPPPGTSLGTAPGSAPGSGPGEPSGTALAIELHEALEPLSPHLAPAGRESVLLQGARIALADGPYTPAEREVLTTVGRALQLCAGDTARLMAAARTPF